MTRIRAWAAHGAKQKLEPIVYEADPVDPEEVEIRVEFCGLCHSDLSMLNNEWGVSQYPLILGHEAVGRITAVGDQVKGLRIGQHAGVGWISGSCMYCHECMTGSHNLCAKAVPTIVGHPGGFAEKIRSHWAWAVPLPDALDISSAGPLLCAGTTVFAPFVNYGVKPPDRVGIVGIGGLGHLALQFASAWGCEVTAFSSNPSKTEEVKKFGAHRVVSSRDRADILKAANSLDFLLVTTNVPLDWSAFFQTLKPNGRMHIVGVVLEPISVGAFADLIAGQKNISGSYVGSPSAMSSMLDFASRHHIAPQVEHFPMSKVNEAIAHLAAGKARYRVVLDADFE